MYMTAMQQNPAAMMLMPYMAQYPMYSRMALPTEVSAATYMWRMVVLAWCVTSMNSESLGEYHITFVSGS